MYCEHLRIWLISAMNNHNHIIQNLLRGTAAVYSETELASKLAKSTKLNKPLRIKLGLDPSSPDIHIGHAVVLRLLRKFQDIGHTAVLIIGDYTARIGDPSGKSKTRPVLSNEQIEENSQTYLEQAVKILDPNPAKLELRKNSEWLSKLTFEDIIRLTAQITVARMLERDTFDLRYKAGQPICLHEFLYPIMQGWDSVCVEADVELGGTDQTFNNLIGRDFQQYAQQEPQVVIVCPILRGLDGSEKMSKSLGNYIGVTESSDDMYGKTMSIPDELMPEWFELCTDISKDEINVLCDADKTHPRTAKDVLAQHIVERYHGKEAASAASLEFISRFREGNLPTDIDTIVINQSPIGIIALLREVGFASSNGEARRLIEQGAVAIDDSKINDPLAEIPATAESILRVGKRRVCKIVIGE